VRTLLVLTACCGVFFWAARHVWESQHPLLVIARGLQSWSPSERVFAIRELERFGIGESETAIPPLVAALKDSKAEVRVAAAESLRPLVSDASRNGSPSGTARGAISALIASLTDRNPEVRLAAANTLAYIASSINSDDSSDLMPVMTALAAMLGDTENRVRMASLHGLANCAPHVSIEPPDDLIAAMDDDSSTNRALAVTALAAFRRNLDPWIPALLRKLEHDEPEVRNACGRALGRRPPPAASLSGVPTLIAALASKSPDVQFWATTALEQLGSQASEAVPHLIGKLSQPNSPDPSGSKTALSLSSDPPQVAAYALGKIAPGTTHASDAIRALREVMRAGLPDRRRAAINALGEFGTAAAVVIPDLLKLVKDSIATDDSNYVGGAAANVLSMLAPGTASSDDAVEVLKSALRAQSFGLRLAAINALPRFGPKAAAAVPQLRAMSKDAQPLIKDATNKALTALDAKQ
jgi:HEAT repeat protein